MRASTRNARSGIVHNPSNPVARIPYCVRSTPLKSPLCPNFDICFSTPSFALHLSRFGLLVCIMRKELRIQNRRRGKSVAEIPPEQDATYRPGRSPRSRALLLFYRVEGIVLKLCRA